MEENILGRKDSSNKKKKSVKVRSLNAMQVKDLFGSLEQVNSSLTNKCFCGKLT
ncbi:unnamed protein product [Meloidogyne enterolobii]|uniref:Uncharacterized protein n=1 Tax=Meloidogyne enterolobii TaxID=390850 RepID=A0ACB0ZEQ2_MELEN